MEAMFFVFLTPPPDLEGTSVGVIESLRLAVAPEGPGTPTPAQSRANIDQIAESRVLSCFDFLHYLSAPLLQCLSNVGFLMKLLNRPDLALDLVIVLFF